MPSLGRRQLFKVVSCFALQDIFSYTLCSAQVTRTSSTIGSFSVSSRLLLDNVLFKDPAAYLAFATVVAQNQRGRSAQSTYDQELSDIKSKLSAYRSNPVDPTLRGLLDTALTNMISIDCCLHVSETASPVALGNLLSPAFEKVGFAGLIARQTGDSLPLNSLSSLNPSSILSNISGFQILTSAPNLVSSLYAGDGLTLLSSQNGIQSILASGGGILREANILGSKAQSVSNAINSAAGAANNLIASFQDMGSATAGNSVDANQLAADASTAMVALGSLTKMNPSTVKKVSEGISIAGSALSGALAGAAFGGPIGGAIGGVMGLLGGLFGGGEDPNAQMLSQLDSKMSQLSNDMTTGFNALSNEIGTVGSQIEQSIAGISNQVQNLGGQIEAISQQDEQILEQLKQLAATTLQTTVNSFTSNADVYEDAYRQYILTQNNSSSLQILQSQLLVAKDNFNDLINVPEGFSQDAFVGQSFNQFIQTFLKYYVCSLSMVSNFSPGSTAQASVFTSTSSPIPASNPPDVRGIIDQFSSRLVDGRYGVPADQNGAAIVNFLQQNCVGFLTRFPNSNEFGLMTDGQKLVIPSSTQTIPLAIAPQDLFTMSQLLVDVATSLSDTSTAYGILQDYYDILLPNVAIHSLFVNQDSVPILLYLRGQIAVELSNNATAIFCNSFMAGVFSLQRAFSTAASQGATYTNNMSPPMYRVSDVATAQSLSNLGRSSLPLSNSATLTLPVNIPEASQLTQSFTMFFNYLPKVPSASVLPFINNAGGYESQRLAHFLPGVVQQCGGVSLTERLNSVLTLTILLGVIESCLSTKLTTLNKQHIDTPKFENWSAGFMEYASLAACALQQGPITQTAAFPSEYNIAHTVLLMILGGWTPLTNPQVPQYVPPAGYPYPQQIGEFWGWGAENCTPFEHSDLSNLNAALMRPECAFAGANSMIAATTEILASIQSLLTQYGATSSLVQALKLEHPKDVAKLLRNLLA